MSILNSSSKILVEVCYKRFVWNIAKVSRSEQPWRRRRKAFGYGASPIRERWALPCSDGHRGIGRPDEGQIQLDWCTVIIQTWELFTKVFMTRNGSRTTPKYMIFWIAMSATMTIKRIIYSAWFVGGMGEGEITPLSGASWPPPPSPRVCIDPSPKK